MDNIKSAMEAKKSAFEHKCYEAYKLRWMIAHGDTLQEFVDTLGDIAAESVEEDAMCAVTDGESAIYPVFFYPICYLTYLFC